MNVNNIITYNNDEFIIDSEPGDDSESHQTPSQINKSRKLEIDDDEVQFKKSRNSIQYNDNTEVKLIDHGSGEDQKPNGNHYQDNLTLKENR